MPQIAKAARDGYDHASLYPRLREVKQRFPAERTIHIAAQMDIP